MQIGYFIYESHFRIVKVFAVKGILSLKELNTTAVLVKKVSNYEAGISLSLTQHILF